MLLPKGFLPPTPNKVAYLVKKVEHAWSRWQDKCSQIKLEAGCVSLFCHSPASFIEDSQFVSATWERKHHFIVNLEEQPPFLLVIWEWTHQFIRRSLVAWFILNQTKILQQTVDRCFILCTILYPDCWPSRSSCFIGMAFLLYWSAINDHFSI